MAPSPTPSEDTRGEDTFNPDGPLAPAEPMAVNHHKPTDAVGSGNENTNRLARAINEQSASLKAVLESVTKAVEALKQQPQSPDKNTTFWMAYKKLADEFDKELQGKYGDDLDTSLIFAGLFSAVNSAFIIQLQPELQPDPNASTQALLTLLVQNITGLPSATLPLGVSMSQPMVPTIVVIAQSLLYVSLFATLLAALLAVLGKQWLLHYNSVGERGTIEERGLERQRKVNGMRRWRFELVMQVFPLLLQFSLLLFATALSIYLWTIHHMIATIVVTLTGLASMLYAVMIITAVASPDSPFQTSLSFLLKIILDRFPVPESWRRFVEDTSGRLYRALGKTRTILFQRWTACITRMMPPLPMFHTSKPHDPQPTPIFDSPGPPSKEASAVLWALETSTDPRLVEIAAEMVPDLQGPVNLDARPALKRLDDMFRSCLNGHNVRDGMTNRATACIRAFWVLDMVTEEDQQAPNLWTCDRARVYNASGDLVSIQFWTHRPLTLSYGVAPITPWSLRFIAAQNSPKEMLKTILWHFNPSDSIIEDESIFADFLFCLNSFFICTAPQDHSIRDKRKYTTLLIALLLENLVRHLTDAHPLDPSIANDTVIKVAQIADRISFRPQPPVYRHINAGYRFCALRSVSQEAIAAVLRLVRIEPWGLNPRSFPADLSDTTWLSRTLESVGSSNTRVYLISDLWQALFLLRSARDTLWAGSLRVLLSMLSTEEGDPFFDDWAKESKQVAYFACDVLDSADHWFADDELRHILQQRSIWANLGRVGEFTPSYTNLGDKLSREPEWKNIISNDLPGWLGQWPTIINTDCTWFTDEHRAQFRSVLSRVWDADESEADEFGEEATVVMVFSALAKTWNRVHFLNLDVKQVRYHINLLCSTVWAAFSARIRPLPPVIIPSQRFKDTIMVCLAEALVVAGENVKHGSGSDYTMELDLKDSIDRLADLLSGLAFTIQGELRTPQHADTVNKWGYWYDLQNTWLQEVAALREAFEKAASERLIMQGSRGSGETV